MRAKAIMELPLDFMPNDQFARIRTEKQKKEILGPIPPSNQPPKRSRPPSGLPPYLASLYEVPLLTREQETHLFRRMNFLKYQAAALQSRIDPDHPVEEEVEQAEQCLAKANAIRDRIV